MKDYEELKKAAEYAQSFESHADEAEEFRALSEFYDVVDPYDVLELIADNESLHKHWENESNNVQVMLSELIKLKAEIECLRKALTNIRDESDDLGACECAADALIDSHK